MASFKRPEEQTNAYIVTCPGCAGTGSHFPNCFKASPGPGGVRTFTSGATRSADDGKNPYVGYLSVPVLEEFGDYMTRHRVQPDGSQRDPDNWKKGIPIGDYLQSLFRHVIELVGLRTGYVSRRLRREYPGMPMDFLTRETACAILFNIQGFLHEYLKEEPETKPDSLWEAWKVKAQEGLPAPTDYIPYVPPPWGGTVCQSCGARFGFHHQGCIFSGSSLPSTLIQNQM